MNARTRDTLIAVAATVGLLVVWELAVRRFKIPPFVLPAPSPAIEALPPVWGGGMGQAWQDHRAALGGIS